MGEVIVVGRIEYPDHSRPHQQDYVQFAGGGMPLHPSRNSCQHPTLTQDINVENN